MALPSQETLRTIADTILDLYNDVERGAPALPNGPHETNDYYHAILGPDRVNGFRDRNYNYECHDRDPEPDLSLAPSRMTWHVHISSATVATMTPVDRAHFFMTLSTVVAAMRTTWGTSAILQVECTYDMPNALLSVRCTDAYDKAVAAFHTQLTARCRRACVVLLRVLPERLGKQKDMARLVARTLWQSRLDMTWDEGGVQDQRLIKALERYSAKKRKLNADDSPCIFVRSLCSHQNTSTFLPTVKMDSSFLRLDSSSASL